MNIINCVILMHLFSIAYVSDNEEINIHYKFDITREISNYMNKKKLKYVSFVYKQIYLCL